MKDFVCGLSHKNNI